MQCDEDHTFENWAKTLRFRPKRFCRPETIEDVAQLVRDARAAGTHVRVQGAEHSHSWSQFTLTNDTLVNLDKLNKPLIADITNKRFTVQGGIRIKDLVRALALDGLGLRNLGSIMEQSIAGAVSTGTHGTGLRLGNLATQVVGMKIVSGTGDIKELTSADTALLRAARVSLGALGIVSELTLECVQNYDLEFNAYWCRFEDVIDQIDTLNQENERVRLWWFPKTLFGIKHNMVVSTMNPVGTPPGILGAWQQTRPTTLSRSALPLDLGLLFGALQLLAGNSTLPVQVARFTDNYVNVLTLPLIPVLHRECEYAIPVEHTRAALLHLKEILEEGDMATTLPVEVRFVASDDTLLSPANGRPVCYIGANTQENAAEVFQRFEPFMKSLGGRPHWGKHFTMTRDEISRMYPGAYPEFATLRTQWDPDNVLANSLIHDLFD